MIDAEYIISRNINSKVLSEKKMIASFSENSGLATVSLRIEMSDFCALKV